MKKTIALIMLIILPTLIGCNKEIDNNSYSENEEKSNTILYEFGLPTNESSIDYNEVITNNYSNTIIKLENEQLSVCIYINNTLECFKNNNFEEEKSHFKTVFGSKNCELESSNVWCNNSNFSCNIYSNGDISCADYINGRLCMINDNMVDCT